MDNIYSPFELHQLLMATASAAKLQLDANPVLADHELPLEMVQPPIKPESSGK